MSYYEWRRSYCLKCGKCCLETEMILLDEDISCIKSLGYDPRFFVRKLHGHNVLKNVNGHCVFFNPKKRNVKFTSIGHWVVGFTL